MLSKRKIDKKLKKYVKDHLSKGHSNSAVKKVLVEHGYDENYVEGLFKKHYELQFIKKYAIIVSMLFIISFFSFNFIMMGSQNQEITAYAPLKTESLAEGCCLSVCQQIPKQDCYGEFVEKKECNEIDECVIGCCIDKEGYCLTNYLLGNCIGNYGKFIKNDCSNLLFCRNLTDKSYSARLYNVKNKKGSGFSSVMTSTDYHKSSFIINYFLYDKTDVVGVIGEIKDNEKILDMINLYDDGFHNDGVSNDNLYGNNWQSSNVKEFNGIKKLEVYVTIKYADGKEQKTNKTQTIILVRGKCPPIYSEWSEIKDSNIIFAANNYENISNGYDKFAADVQNFLNLFFSVNDFSDYLDEFNIYRLEQSLSYFNTPTLLSVVANSCQSYNKKTDLVVILDNAEQYCNYDGENVVRVSPQVMFYNNMTYEEINETFDKFCDYVLTPRKIADQILSFATPPEVNINTAQDITYNSSSIIISFEVSGVNYPINYSVFDKGGLLQRNVAFSKFSADINVNLTNGTNDFMIVALDKNRNRAVTYISLNATIE
ncbi:hypothetical protein HYY70_03265 [Candidatus Woesearchaeota archaeon]|nr:hypothetical protein [Candidatus Woesearchaeota archaeon]